jgi:hypothetical protein
MLFLSLAALLAGEPLPLCFDQFAVRPPLVEVVSLSDATCETDDECAAKFGGAY